KGVYSIYHNQLNLFHSDKTKVTDSVVKVNDLDDAALLDYLQEKEVSSLKDETELVNGVYGVLDISLYKEGLLAPVFFGSAINNFGIKELLDTFIEIAPSPRLREAEERDVLVEEKNFSGFVFK